MVEYYGGGEYRKEIGSGCRFPRRELLLLRGNNINIAKSFYDGRLLINRDIVFPVQTKDLYIYPIIFYLKNH